MILPSQPIRGDKAQPGQTNTAEADGTGSEMTALPVGAGRYDFQSMASPL